MAAIEKYRPANGFEGMEFEDKFCCKCQKFQNAQGQYCNININAMLWDVEHQKYPSEWVYDQRENPVCTAFEERRA